MKYLLSIIFLIFTMITGSAFGQESINSEKVKLELINSMVQDGYLSSKMGEETKNKYVDPNKIYNAASAKGQVKGVTTEDKAQTRWVDYLSWLNFIKVLAISLLLFAFWGTIKKFMAGIWHLVVKVPVIVYQIAGLILSLIATISPELIWASQALYIALFGSIANLIIIGSIGASYPKVAEKVLKLFQLGIPPASIACFWLMVYFGALAFHYNSQIFGFFSIVALSGVFSFTLYYSVGTLWLYFKQNALSVVVFGHLFVLVAYVILHTQALYTNEIRLFETGLQYYTTIALATGLLCGASPWWKDNSKGIYILLMLVVFAASTFGYFFLDIKVIGSIITCFFILFCLEWIAYIGFQGGFILGAGICGGVLYGLALMLEKYGSYIMLTVN